MNVTGSIEVRQGKSQIREGRFVYVVLFFLASPFFASWIATKYFNHLSVVPGASLWNASHYFRFVLWFVETLVVLIVCEAARHFGTKATTVATKEPLTFGRAVYGAIAGVLLAGISVPILIRQPIGLTPIPLLINDFYSFRAVAFGLLIFIAAPITSEYAFRRIVFGDLSEYAGFWAAAFGSSVLFGYLWPVYGFVPGFLLGMLTAFLYNRMNSLIPCVLADAVFTIASVCFGAWRHLSH